jgi:tetratricopeptide (TPR) repeat protein
MPTHNTRRARHFMCCAVSYFVLALVTAASAQTLGDESRIKSDAGLCVSETCLLDAAEADANNVQDERIVILLRGLVRTNQFSAAMAAATQIKSSNKQDEFRNFLNRQNTEQAIVLSELSIASWAHPTDVVSYDRLDALPDASGNHASDFEIASRYWLLAETIIERFEPSLVSLPLAKLLRPKVLRHGLNATLNDLLHVHWPALIEKMPNDQQGELWNYVAEIYTEMGDATAADANLDLAEQHGAYDSQGNSRIYVSTMHSWLRLGNFDRALVAAQHTDPKDTRALMKVQIAEELIAAGQKERAKKIFDEAVADFEKLDNKSRYNGLLLEVLKGYMDVNDPADAKRLADRVLEVARQPALFPSSELAEAARGYNDVGDHARALDLLHEAVKGLPDDHKVIGFGVTLGPISGSTLGVSDEIRSEIAREFYRAGDQKEFDEQFALLGPFQHNEIKMWLWHNDLGTDHPELSPRLDAALDALPVDSRLSVILEFSTDAVTFGETEAARTLLKKARDSCGDKPNPLALAEIAKVAFAGGYSDLTVDILHKAALAAFKIEDKGKRAVALAAVAAAEHELLN